MATAEDCALRATNELHIGPDWATNMELCDLVNMDPGQAKDVIKLLKKRLGNKNPKIQILTLFVLETLSKNCGDSVHAQIAERDILHEMVKIVKKKPDLAVKEKILALIDEWQEAFGGSGGRYPQYHAAYQELRKTGVVFPPREENSVPLFTPPQTHPIVHLEPSSYEDVAVETSLRSEPQPLSSADIQNAHGIAGILMEMLNAVEPNNSEGLKQEVIVDLVAQCRSYQTRVMFLVNNSGDEEILFSGLALNDELQRVIQRYEDLLKGKNLHQPTALPAAPLVNVDPEYDEPEDDFSQLAHRSHGRGPSPLLPPPPPSTRPIHTEKSQPVDFLSGDSYEKKKSAELEVNVRSIEDRTLEVNPTSFLPPPPAKHNQREEFFKQSQGSSSETSSEGFIRQTGKLSISEEKGGNDFSPRFRTTKPEDNLFKDLLDFAKTKSPTSKATSKRTF